MSNLPLIDDRQLVPVNVLDRVLDRDDVEGPRRVEVIDDGGLRRRLA